MLFSLLLPFRPLACRRTYPPFAGYASSCALLLPCSPHVPILLRDDIFLVPFSIRNSLPIFLTKKEPHPSGPRFPFAISIHSWRYSIPARMNLFRSPVPQPPSRLPPCRRTRQSVWSLPFQRLCSANTPRQSACVPWFCCILSPLSEVVSPLCGRLSKRAWVFPPLAAQR